MNNIFEICIIAFLIYLSYISSFYLPSYFKKKGENLAQTQDIETLTKKIDSIKQEFIERTEYLKAKLDLSTQLQLSHINEERNAIMSFLRAFTNYYSICIDTTFAGIDNYDNLELVKYRTVVDNAYNQLRISRDILSVFLEDEEFFKMYGNLHSFLIKLELEIKHLIGELNLNNKNIKRCREDVGNSKQSENHQKLLNERAVFQKKYNDAIIGLPDSFYSNMKAFNKYIKKHLVKSIE